MELHVNASSFILSYAVTSHVNPLNIFFNRRPFEVCALIVVSTFNSFFLHQQSGEGVFIDHFPRSNKRKKWHEAVFRIMNEVDDCIFSRANISTEWNFVSILCEWMPIVSHLKEEKKCGRSTNWMYRKYRATDQRKWAREMFIFIHRPAIRAGQQMEMNPLMILTALRVSELDWVPFESISKALPSTVSSSPLIKWAGICACNFLQV